MRFTEDDRFEILLYDLVNKYELEWDDPNLFMNVFDAAYAELAYHEHIEDYEHCALLRDFINWNKVRT